MPLKIRLPAEAVGLFMIGLELPAVTTLTKPLFNWDKSQTRPDPGVDGLMLANEPVALVVLNNWKLLPAAKGEPLMLVSVSIPP